MGSKISKLDAVGNKEIRERPSELRAKEKKSDRWERDKLFLEELFERKQKQMEEFLERKEKERQKFYERKQKQMEEFYERKEKERQKFYERKEKEREKLFREELLELKKELSELKSKVAVQGDVIMNRLQRVESCMFATLWLGFWGELSSTVSLETTEIFRKELVMYYGDAMDKMNVEVPEKPLRCMVTDLRLPGKWITAGHLLGRKDKAKAHVFGIHDIDDPRNGSFGFEQLRRHSALSRLYSHGMWK